MRLPQKNRVILSLSLLLALGAAYGQEKPGVRVLTKSTEAGVVVRWAPSTPVAWQLGNDYGYTVTRYTLADTDSLAFTEKKVLTPNGLTILPELDWESVAKQDKWGAIAAQAIYGDDFVMTTPTEGPASFANEAAELENRFSFSLVAADVSAPVADAMALRWVDKQAVRGVTYVYRVELNGEHQHYPVEKGSSKITFTEPQPLPRPQEVDVTFGDRSVSLSWNTFYLQRTYTSYLIERSDDDGKTFFLPNELQFFTLRKEGSGPLQKMYYLDSIPNNGIVYHYRVKGITPFGEVGPPSDPVQGQGAADLGDAVPVVRETVVLEDGTVDINWEFTTGGVPRIEKFSVSRAPKAGGPYTEISTAIAPDSMGYRDVDPMSVNYYVVKAFGKNGEVRKSFPVMVQLEDSIPPAPPQGLAGTMDKNGIVSIRWAANKEPDLHGYRVFRSNSTQEEYVQRSQETILTPAFRDSINIHTLTEEVVYTVTAQDRRYNKSAYARPLVLKRPDIVPPVKPVLKRLTPLAGSIHIEWYASSSDDLAFYKLFRKKSSTNIWKEFVISKDSTAFTDQLSETGHRYDYSLMAVDDDQLASEAEQFSGSPLGAGLPAVVDARSRIDREKGSIQLSWGYGMEFTEMIIYRKENDGPLRRYARLQAGEERFTDHDLKVGASYGYRIKVIDASGEESPLSEEIKVVY